MIDKVNALADRLLAAVLPKTTAKADPGHCWYKDKQINGCCTKCCPQEGCYKIVCPCPV